MTSVPEQRFLWPQCTWLAAIVSALATSQLGCGWVGRWNDGLVLCCTVLCCAVWNTVAVIPLLIVTVFAGRKEYGNILATDNIHSQYCRCWMFLLSMSRDFKGAITDNLHHLIAPTGGPLLYTYIHVFILSRYPGTMTVYSYFKVLGSQCHYSMYYCCCILEIHAFVPNLCRPRIYQDNHDRFSKTPTIHAFYSSRTAT